MVAEVQVGLGPEGAAVDARRRRAYVTCSRSDQVSVVDLDRLEVIDQVVVGHEPIDAVLDEQSGRLFVCNLRSSSVTVIDTAAAASRARWQCRHIPRRWRRTSTGGGCTAGARRAQQWR